MEENTSIKKKKKKFFQLKVRSSIKHMQRTEIIPYMKGAVPPQHIALYDKV